jgi:hypothetical protein
LIFQWPPIQPIYKTRWLQRPNIRSAAMLWQGLSKSTIWVHGRVFVVVFFCCCRPGPNAGEGGTSRHHHPPRIGLLSGLIGHAPCMLSPHAGLTPSRIPSMNAADGPNGVVRLHGDSRLFSFVQSTQVHRGSWCSCCRLTNNNTELRIIIVIIIMSGTGTKISTAAAHGVLNGLAPRRRHTGSVMDLLLACIGISLA